MTAWFWFWMISVGASALLFFGIAALVILRGWRDMMDLYSQLKQPNDEINQETTVVSQEK